MKSILMKNQNIQKTNIKPQDLKKRYLNWFRSPTKYFEQRKQSHG